jgi:hypothetical protein
MFDGALEQVAIDAVHVGDFVCVASQPTSAAHVRDARCVIAKRANVNARTDRVVGWLVELSDGELAWWPRGWAVWRRRIA